LHKLSHLRRPSHRFPSSAARTMLTGVRRSATADFQSRLRTPDSESDSGPVPAAAPAGRLSLAGPGWVTVPALCQCARPATQGTHVAILNRFTHSIHTFGLPRTARSAAPNQCARTVGRGTWIAAARLVRASNARHVAIMNRFTHSLLTSGLALSAVRLVSANGRRTRPGCVGMLGV